MLQLKQLLHVDWLALNRVNVVAFSCIGRFFLIFWPLESVVTVVPEAKIESPNTNLSVGHTCTVREGKKSYTGKVAAIGMLQ